MAILIVACTLLAYLPALRAGFIWDDPDYVVDNPVLRDLPGLWRLWTDPQSIPQYYPLVHTTFWLEYHLWGLWSPGYHATNILLHACAAILLYHLLRALKVPAPLLGALLFALHPVNVESVAWVTERKNVLCAVFTFASALTWTRWRHLTDPLPDTDPLSRHAAVGSALADVRPPSPGTPDCHPERSGAAAESKDLAPHPPPANRLYILLLTLFLAAMLSKTIAATLPPSLLIITWWKKGKLTRHDLLPLLPLFAIGLLGGLFTAHLEAAHVGATGKEWAFTPVDRILIAARATTFYATKLLLPIHLSFIYPRWHIDPRVPQQWLYPTAIPITLLVLFALRNRIGRAPLATALIYITALLPALGFVNVYPMRYSFVADHFQYLATAPALAFLAAALHLTLRRLPSSLIPLPSSLLVLLLALLTFTRTFAYESPLTLWTDTLAKNPDSWMVQFHYAEELIEQAQRPGTTAQGRASLEQDAFSHLQRAVDLAPDLPETHWNLGLWYARAADRKNAQTQFEQALEKDPTFARAYSSLADIKLAQGDPSTAISLYKKAISLEPAYPVAHYRLGVALEKSGQPQQALLEYAAAVNLKPTDPDFRYNLATLLLHQGDLANAIYHYQTLLAQTPHHPEARTNLGAIYLQLNQPAAAEQQFRLALQDNPTLVPAQRGLDRARQMQGH